MFEENKVFTEDYYDKYMSELDILDQAFDEPIYDEQFTFGDNIFSIVQNLINPELNEEYTTETGLMNHFKKHCIRADHVSSRQNVYYDFTDVNDYSNHELEISEYIDTVIDHNDKMFITDIYDTDKLIKSFRKLFAGNETLVFSLSCGFHNKFGLVRICIHSFATKYTENYLHNTVDFLIQAPDRKTISLYPIDANYLENKINNEIAKIPTDILLKINH